MSKVLWICTARVSPDGQIHSASWIEAFYHQIASKESVHLTIASPSGAVKKVTVRRVSERLKIISLPLYTKKIYKVSARSIKEWTEILKREDFDIIQIFGTEYALHLAAMKAVCQLQLQERTVIWIQGLCSAIASAYCLGLPRKAIRFFSFRDLLRCDNIACQKLKYQKRAKVEKRILQSAIHIMGRTIWDRAYLRDIAPAAQYHSCNETLRQAFYGEQIWSFSNCRKHRIFVSQSEYPIKGLHVLIPAVARLAKRFPDIEVYVAGDNPFDSSTWRGRLARSSYAVYLKKMMKKYNVLRRFVFVGRQTSHEMVKQYLAANVFVLPSLMENSPNSLGEAMLLGVPCVASDTGGISTMLKHSLEGFLYDKLDDHMAEQYIAQIFENGEAAEELGGKARLHALQTHDPDTNYLLLQETYRKITGKDIL